MYYKPQALFKSIQIQMQMEGIQSGSKRPRKPKNRLTLKRDTVFPKVLEVVTTNGNDNDCLADD
jgi:hypothetical protein